MNRHSQARGSPEVHDLAEAVQDRASSLQCVVIEAWRVAEAASVRQCALALRTHAKGRNPKWRGVLACRPLGWKVLAPDPAPVGTILPSSTYKLSTCAEMLCKHFSLFYTFVSHGKSGISSLDCRYEYRTAIRLWAQSAHGERDSPSSPKRQGNVFFRGRLLRQSHPSRHHGQGRPFPCCALLICEVSTWTWTGLGKWLAIWNVLTWPGQV